MGMILNLMISDSSATAIEYALIVALIVIVIIGAVTALGQKVLTLYESVVAAFP